MDADGKNKASPAGSRATPVWGRILVGLLFLVTGTISIAALSGLVYLAANYKPYSIPQGAMMPAFEPGDRMLARRNYYTSHEVRRSDIATFRRPGREQIVFVMRVVGLAGEMVQIRDGILHIDGKAVERRAVDGDVPGYPRSEHPDARQYFEIPPGGDGYRIIEGHGDASVGDNTPLLEVPAGHVFVLGDNRDNSKDSRYIGFVPRENLMDRPEFIFWSNDYSRIGRFVE